MRSLAIFLTGLAAAALSACGGEEGANGKDEACIGDGVVVSGAWTKPARAGQPVSAAYMTLCNAEDAPNALTGVSFDGAAAMEIHETEMADGVMKMKKVDALALPPHVPVTLAPGGAHLMLIGVTRDVKTDELPLIQLQFEKGEPVLFAFDVRAEPPAEPK